MCNDFNMIVHIHIFPSIFALPGDSLNKVRYAGDSLI